MPRLTLVAAMATVSITLLVTFAEASHYGPSKVAALELAEAFAAAIKVCSRGAGCRNSHLAVWSQELICTLDFQ